MDNFNVLPKPTKFETPREAEENGFKSNRDPRKSYASVIGMMLYLV